MNGESGFLCEVDNKDSLLHAIEKALQLTNKQRRLMGESAWERVNELRPEKAVRQLLLFYNTVLETKA